MIVLCFGGFVQGVAHGIGIDPMDHSGLFYRFAVAESASETMHSEVGKDLRHRVYVNAFHTKSIDQKHIFRYHNYLRNFGYIIYLFCISYK